MNQFFKSFKFKVIVCITAFFLGIGLYSVTKNGKTPEGSQLIGTVLNPVKRFSNVISDKVSLVIDLFVNSEEYVEENRKLREQIADLNNRLIDYEDIKSEKIIKELLNGKNIALVSDAGTPGISDPGEELVKNAIENNINIVPIPGACAFVNALIISGINTKEFVFYGFLPMNKKNRKEKLEEISKENKTVILYEAPHKLLSTLKDISNALGEETNIVLAKEITKIHEEFIRGRIGDIIDKTENVKGEFIIIIDNKQEKNENDNISNQISLDEQYERYKTSGLTKKEIIKKIAKERNVSKNEIYQYFLKK